MRRALVILLGLAACTPPDETPATTVKPPPPAAPAFPADPLPTLDFAAASAAARALDTVSPEYQLTIAARGLAEVERGRLSDPLVAGIDALALADPAERSRLVAAALDSPEAAAGWALSCTGTLAELTASLGKLPEDRRTHHIVEACEDGIQRLAPGGFAAGISPSQLLLALITLGALERVGRVDPSERRLIDTFLNHDPRLSPGTAGLTSRAKAAAEAASQRDAPAPSP